MKRRLAFLSIIAVLWTASAYAVDSCPTLFASNPYPPKFDLKLTFSRVMKNVGPADSRRGVVVAAQTRHSPNYYFHWTRDAGLTMDVVISQYKRTTEPEERLRLETAITNYVDFSAEIQRKETLTGLGEPKFYHDGNVHNEPWGRPQNDGPAIRAISLIHWAEILIAEGKTELVKKKIYDGRHPSHSVVKKDLEYVSHHWRDPSFDLWEEVKGDHFYTRMVQRRALIEGAQLASTLGDSGAADWYLSQAKEIEKSLESFWDPTRGYFVTTLNRVDGLDYKNSQLDSAFVLGLLHGSLDDGFLPFADPRVQATIEKLIWSFKTQYPINQIPGIAGVAIGRYTEDRFAGANFNGGNPWALCTLAMAEAFYKTADELNRKMAVNRAATFIAKGDEMVRRVAYHSHSDGSLNEQIDRSTGYMTSVEDLTWSYAALITSYWARLEALGRK